MPRRFEPSNQVTSPDIDAILTVSECDEKGNVSCLWVENGNPMKGSFPEETLTRYLAATLVE